MLLLWDIDHTLVEMRGIGTELFGRAFAEVTGVRMERQAAVDGMTDLVIFRETAALHGIQAGPEETARFTAALGRAHEDAVAEIQARGRALPGAREALAALDARGVRQTVVTGNVRGSARVKLSAFALDEPIVWDIGAYGDEAETRPELVRTALTRARAVVHTEDVTLIGDTPADMEGAAAHGVRALAVATGRTGENALAAAGARYTLPDLRDTERLVRLLTGGCTS
ncbi:HAD family hydrolase [Streptomyces avicenniae]|uniref:HAD family hydrolase n=1 Tax=Streptomyces avicenniae TaxID=500153 RepID=UPI00069B09B7|nr:HAD hydrolase-like protein [Streptomyces avicenniae]